jgi:hypothetical protein
VLETPLSGLQQALRGLERDGLVAGRTVGRTRPYRLNPHYFADDDLQRYLLRLTEPRGSPQRTSGMLASPPATRGQAAVRKLTARSSLKQVAAVVADALDKHGIRAILTGGACASIYTRGSCQSALQKDSNTSTRSSSMNSACVRARVTDRSSPR